MTEQYQTEDINGQPSPLSLTVVPSSLVPPAPGAIDTEAIFWPTLAVDAVIVGNGIAVAGSAAVGTIIEFSQPGVFQVDWTTSYSAGPPPSGLPLNILRGAPGPITVANGYPSLDFIGAPSPGIIAVSGPLALGFPPGPPTFLTATFRISDADLENIGINGTINPARQVRFSALSGDIPGIFPPITQINIQRQSR